MSGPDDAVDPVDELDNLAPSPPSHRLRVLGAVVWPAFVSACLIELVVFASFDPEDFQGFGHATWQRETVLSFAFLVFWAVGALAGYVTWLLAREPQ